MAGKDDNTIQFGLRESRVDIVGSTAGSSTDFEKSDSNWSALRICVITTDIINHVLIALMTTLLLFCSLQSFTTMNLHVALCTVGYVLLMSEAIVVLAGENVLTNFLTRRAKSHIHWILQVLGLICIIIGVVIMYRAKTVHFRSIHAITGIVSTALACFLAAFGYPVFAAIKLRKIVRPVVIKFLHNFLGIACFVVGMIAQCYGYQYNWLVSATKSMPQVQLICTICTGLITLFSLRGAIRTLSGQALTLFK